MTTADHAATAPWAGIQAKPETFPPSAHRHLPSEIDRAGANVGDVITWDGRKFAPMAPAARKFIVEAGEAMARFEEELSVVADSSKAAVEKATTAEALFKDSAAKLEERISVVAKAGEASAKKSIELVARLGDAEAKIKRVDEVIVTRDTALARTTEDIRAKIADNSANITTIKSSYATRTFAEAKKTEAIEASTAITTASVTAEALARATADMAIASTVTTVSAQVNHPTTGLPAAHAAVTNEATARATADTAIASTVTTLSAQVNNPTTGLPAAHAAVTNEATARASADGTLSSQITTLSGTVGTVSAAVTTETSNRIAADGAIHQHWGVSLDVNNRITGRVRLDGTGATSTFTILADAIRFYNGTSDIAPFTVSGGVVYLTNVVAEVLKANIQIQTPEIVGGILKLDGTCSIVSDTMDGADTSLVRINGGGSDGQWRGGQLDVFGNEHGAAPGSVLLTPGDAASAAVRLRDRNGTDRVIVEPGGTITLTSNTTCNQTLTAQHLTATGVLQCGGGSSFPVRAGSGRLYLNAGGSNRWFVSDSTGALCAENGAEIKNLVGTGYTVALTTSGGDRIEFIISGGALYYRANGGANVFIA